MTRRWPHRQDLRAVTNQAELDAAIEADEVPLIVARGLIVVGGEMAVHAVFGTVDACEHAHVFAEAAVAIRARDHARVWITDRGRVDAYDHATVVAGGRSRVRGADRSQVVAEERAHVTVLDDAEALCRDESTAHAHGRARVAVSGCARVWATDRANVLASMRASVRAGDQVIVWADAEVTVTREGPGVVVNRERDVETTEVVGAALHADAADRLEVAQLVRSLDELLLRGTDAAATLPRPV